jgi:hypothetical protein
MGQEGIQRERAHDQWRKLSSAKQQVKRHPCSVVFCLCFFGLLFLKNLVPPIHAHSLFSPPPVLYKHSQPFMMTTISTFLSVLPYLALYLLSHTPHTRFLCIYDHMKAMDYELDNAMEELEQTRNGSSSSEAGQTRKGKRRQGLGN